MSNRIRHIRVSHGPISPAQAEVRITVVPERQTPTTEVRGRLMGPRCPYASTIEVAYPLRLPPGGNPTAESLDLTRHVIIPEPSFWDTESPFLYEGPVELWQDGQCCDQQIVRHGLCSLRVGKRGLLINDRPLLLRGRVVTADGEMAGSESDLRMLHEAGFNLLVAPVADETMELWQHADRFGLLILGQLRDDSEATQHRLVLLTEHASCLGWLIESARLPSRDWFPSGGLLGWTGDIVSPETSLAEMDFLFGSPELASHGKALLVTGESRSPSSESVPILGCVP